MKSAKEMFEDLGYFEVYKFPNKKTYRKLWFWYENEEELIREIKENKKIKFEYIEFIDIIGKEVKICLYDVKAEILEGEIVAEIYGEGNKSFGQTLDIYLLRAINKQMEELGEEI